MPVNKKNSLDSKGLRYKLRISVYLMSVLPLLVCMYLVSNYILPKLGFKLDITASVAISIFISWIGFRLVEEIFDRILSVTSDAKMIAAGDINHRVEVKHEDEIGDLGQALNQLTNRIRSNIDELKNYSQRTQEIDLEIKKRLFVLSTLLQISSLISQGAKLEEIFKLTTQKSRLLADSNIAYIFFRKEDTGVFHMKVADGLNTQRLEQVKIEPQDPVFGKLINTGKPLVLDKENLLSGSLQNNFCEKFGLKNTLALPVYLKGKITGILGIGNAEEAFSYQKDDIELLDIFAKQASIAMENDMLAYRVEKLEIEDALTGLYNEAFIRNRLEEEIKRAIVYQRPCAFILFDIADFQKIHHNFGLLYAEKILKRIASLIKNSVTEIDKVARTADNEFAVILPERNKRQSQRIAGEIKKKIEFSFSEEPDADKRITVRAGASENPLDGIDAKELFAKARAALGVAKG